MAAIIRLMGESCLQRGQLFWATVEKIRAVNTDHDPEDVERDVLDAAREIRRKKSRSRTRSR